MGIHNRGAISCELERVPTEVRTYLAHTVNGKSIRSIARDRKCHPSTILRQVRRFEQRRDDPLIDSALRSLVADHAPSESSKNEECRDMPTNIVQEPALMSDGLTQTRIDREALRVLRRMCEHGAILAVARDMDSAVVVREDASGASLRTAVVEREIAQAMALKDWIVCSDPSARIARYSINQNGREALRRLTAEEENRAQGFKSINSDKRDASNSWDLREDLGGGSRYMVTESPLVGLARRKDRDGNPFLSKAQVSVGERLRQDFELSQAGPEVTQDWRSALTTSSDELPKATQDARDRVVMALDELGPGLADVALNCCCFLKGLEATEREMGWSSRSGKIVLRIALTRLERHYEEKFGKFGPLIG